MDELKELITQFHFANGYWVIIIPLILMGIDVLTGVTNAWVKKEIKTSILRAGLGKKMGEIVILVLGEVFLFGMQLPEGFIDAISIYIIIMELLSICENLTKLGVPIPKFVKRALAVAQENIDEDKIEEPKEKPKKRKEEK